ncbi:Holliday junction branch migration protein RuvA [Pyramidobacter sp. SM-530-WT-4B]|uniref:Holliday junction branch migration complex subunit RuvA n=1 Tax=Pyramidobacter porci TaxID=2605789 RepID=A0A6L5Y890_9BACT|nr:Holliday junction branch migration protein RuvA [Pyramidobacter porci]MST54446.1 Holliday junction branch migration protein RuvA [Pyramidobacter porci]
MLASIRGTVVEKSEFTVVVECNGLGVEVLLTRRAAERCELGAQVFLYTLLQIGDAGIALYGFADDTERRTFKLMILTKGVGGKAAISILQYLSPAEIVAAVEQNDIRLLTSVPGIGKKTAERICFELSDRIHKKGFIQLTGELHGAPAGDQQAAAGVLDALESLGFDRASAVRAYKSVVAEQGESLGESEAIMSCLRILQPRK